MQLYLLIGNVKLDTRRIQCRVTQGSVLWPILHLIYVNNLFNGPLKGNITVFADHTDSAYGACSIEVLKLNI